MHSSEPNRGRKSLLGRGTAWVRVSKGRGNVAVARIQRDILVAGEEHGGGEHLEASGEEAKETGLRSKRVLVTIWSSPLPAAVTKWDFKFLSLFYIWGQQLIKRLNGFKITWLYSNKATVSSLGGPRVRPWHKDFIIWAIRWRNIGKEVGKGARREVIEYKLR